MRRHQGSPVRASIQTHGQVPATECSGNVGPPDLPDGLFANGAASGAIVLNGCEGNEPISCKPEVAKIVRSRESSGDPAHRLIKTLMNTRRADTPRAGDGAKLVLEAGVLENHTSGPRSRRRRYRSWLLIACLSPQEITSRPVKRLPLRRWRRTR